MAQHTPGPWEYDEEQGEIYYADPEKVYPRVCSIDLDNTSFEQAISDARLIASAPTILEKAEALLAKIDNMTSDEFSHGDEHKEREELRAAIARARGKG